MSTPSSQRPIASRGSYKQDYVVRIRYNNTLPPPLAPPKLLDIPNNAFAQYTDTTFASRLARAGPHNIELDAELGMPLDLTHVPRVFENDLSAIRAQDPLPAVHPADAALLRPAASLGKPITSTPSGGSNVSFLRRTEYISAENTKSTFRSQAERALHSARQQKLRSARPEDSDPVRILAAVMRGFDTANPDSVDAANAVGNITDKAAANAERNWRELRHPNKPALKPVGTYPLLPDPAGFSDSRGYMVFKFSAAPTDSRANDRDARMDAAVLNVVDVNEEELADDENPEARQLFDLYVPATAGAAAGVKRKFAEDAQDAENEEFMYGHVRRYEVKNHQAYQGADGNHPEELALCFRDGKAFFYPVLARFTIRPRRKAKFAPGMPGRDEEEEAVPPEGMKLRVRELEEGERRRREEFRAGMEGRAVEAKAEAAEDEDAPGEEE